MKTSDDIFDRIMAEVLIAMPHVAKVIHFRNTDTSWRLLGQVANGTDLLEHQLSVNEITREMVVDDIAKTRHDYESRQQTVDPAGDSYLDVTLALQAIQDYGTKASLVIAGRQAAICKALETVRTHRRALSATDPNCFAMAS